MGTALLYSKVKDSLVRNSTAKTDADKRYLAAMFMVAAACTLMPELAMAAPWDSVATNILGIFTGGLTRTIAIIAVIACGIAALAGKLSWDWAIKIILGIVLIFGSATIVDYVISAAS